ncbi:unnamed protein product, partial [Brassica rapa subsp. trilocularis]
QRLKPAKGEQKKPPPPGNKAGVDGALEASTSRETKTTRNCRPHHLHPPPARVVTPNAAPPLVSVHPRR